MTDLLVAFMAFFLTFQASSQLLGAAARQPRWSSLFQGSRGLALILIPTLVGLGLVGASLLPHLLGALADKAHAASDQDLLETGGLSPLSIAILAFVGARLALRLIVEARLSAHLRAAARTPDDAVLAKVREACSPRPGSRPPRLRFHGSPRFYEPFVRGLFRPSIFLHVDLVAALDFKHLRAAMLHEIGHRERRDHLICGLYSLALSPIGLGKTLRRGFEDWAQSSERACDDFASRTLGSRRAVAEALVAVFKLVSQRPAPTSTNALCGHRSIKQRVARLIDPDPKPQENPAPSRLLAASGLLTAAAVLFVGLLAPSLGLELYCFFEHLVGTHCVG